MTQINLGGHRALQQQAPVNAAQNAANAQAPGPIQFRSGNKSLFTRIADRLGLSAPGPNTPHARFTAVTPSKKHALTNNLLGVRDEVMGKKADRQDVNNSRANITNLMQTTFVNGVRTDSTPRLNTNYSITTSKGDTLHGFSMSANPAATQLDTTRPVVVFFSGSGGSAEKYGGEIGKHYSVDKNCNFVALNYRGYGQSTDVTPSETTIVKDGIEVINHLLSQGFSPDQIIVHGYSMGATVAAHVQARVEESGYALKGAVYDRPMSSATGAAKDHMAGDMTGIKKSIVGGVASFGTKITTGSMSAKKTLQALKNAAPNNQLRTPTYMTFDQGAFGDRSNRMGQSLGLNPIDIQGGHFDHFAAIRNGFSQFPATLYA